MEKDLYCYKVLTRTINGVHTEYVEHQADIIDIILSPEYGDIVSVESITVHRKGSLAWGGPE